MCGIAGAMGLKDLSIIQNMMHVMQHRGPDYMDYTILDEVHFAHTRLSILDLSSLSNQPLWDSQKKACIVFNGEIYNYRELRQELLEKGFIFTSNGDAEVLLNLYLDSGVSCLKRLNGIFSLAIWDTLKKELLLARDECGVKPLYYMQDTDGFYFASEMKALLEIPSVSRELNYDAIFRTIVFLWSPGPDTILKKILKLEPGYYLIIKNKTIVQKSQYSATYDYNLEKMSVSAASDRIQCALYASVSDQLVSDVPIGSFLSGGLDSSLIVSMLKKLSIDLECFTIQSMNSDSDGAHDDLPYAKKVADYLGVSLNVVETQPNILTLLPKMIYHLDEPQADPAPLNVWLICEEARKKGIKVLFSGAGGDDIFSGYRRHRAVSFEKYWSWLPKSMRRAMQYMARKLPKKLAFFRQLSKLFTYASLSENERLLSYFYWIPPDIALGLFTEEIQSELAKDPMASMLRDLSSRTEKNKLEKMLYLERRYFLIDHNLNYTDKMSMANGVEVRVPFLDARVLNIASRVNTKLKQRYGEGKWILKKMAARYLPKEVIYRPKTGFGTPLRHWLKHDLKSLVDEILSVESLEKRALFKPLAVRALIEDDRKEIHDYSYPIFALICIEMWCRIFIDQDELKG